MIFDGSLPSPADEEFERIESRFGIKIPFVLRQHFERANGGTPRPYLFQMSNDLCLISRCLTLAGNGYSSAEYVYYDFVVKKNVIPANLFPFADDGSSNFYLSDCTAENGLVVRWFHDMSPDRLVPAGIGLREFWRIVEETGTSP